jgi:hypothetical protein
VYSCCCIVIKGWARGDGNSLSYMLFVQWMLFLSIRLLYVMSNYCFLFAAPVAAPLPPQVAKRVPCALLTAKKKQRASSPPLLSYDQLAGGADGSV